VKSGSTVLAATVLIVAFAAMPNLTIGTTESSATASKIEDANSAVPSSTPLMRKAYLALVKDSIVPANPRVVANAALAVIASLAPDRALPLSADFGTDMDRDASWLAERVINLSPLWPVFDAMAHATGTAHVGFGTPERKKGIGALMVGEPLSTPGFNFYHLADDRYVVFDVVKGASADTSGVQVGDVLVSIDGVPTARLDSFLLTILPVDTTRELVVGRGSHRETIKLHLTKSDFPPVESRLLEDRMGYVFVRWFARSQNARHDTAALAREAFMSLAAQGARGLILDLRSCRGGIGDVGMASALCDGDVVYFVQQPLSAGAKPVKREGERCWSQRPMVVLINEETVSAPEALALSLRELAHATIIGQPSAGALTVFSFVPLADGYAMTIPTGIVLGPVTGKDQPDHSIQPDIEIPNPSIEDLLKGIDVQLDAGRDALTRNLKTR
jgi:C-terminal processing protease CtpA/Prc